MKIINSYGLDVISVIKPAEGFWVKSTSDISLEFTGEPYGIEKVEVSPGWNLAGTGKEIYLNEIDSNSIPWFGNISTVWKWEGNKWAVWSPDEKIMKIIEKYADKGSIEVLKNIEPYDGFWVKAKQAVYINFCGASPSPSGGFSNEDFKNLLMANLLNFLKVANGQTVTIFEDEEIFCNFIYDGNSTLSLTNCSNPDCNGEYKIDWEKLEIVGKGDKKEDIDKVVWADNNTLCVNYEEGGIYRTSCAVINVPQLTDDEILTDLTQGSRVPLWYNPEVADWEPVGVCLTVYDNGTVVYEDKNNNVMNVCNYVVDNGTVVITCDKGGKTITKKSKIISFLNIPEENATGNVINVKFYDESGNLLDWEDIISIKVESCESFWEKYYEKEGSSQD